MRNLWRWVAAVALLFGIFVVGWNFPSRPTDSWEVVHKFRFDGEICNDLRQSREGTVYVVPEDAGSISISKVARWFSLEVDTVCTFSGRPAGCGGTALQSGEELPLPLALDGTVSAPKETP